MLKLKHLEVRDAGFVDVTYCAEHCTPGRSGTSLELDVTLRVNRKTHTTWASVTLAPEVKSADADVALDKLAEWAERLALSIRNRGAGAPVAMVFDNPCAPSP